MTIKSSIFAAVAGAAFVFSVGAASAQNWQANPTYGSVQLRSGFQPDPHNIQMTAGGEVNARAALGNACPGFIANAPDFDLYWQAGNSGLPLVISADSQADTTLVVHTPSGQWLCEDDGGFNGLNPGMRIDNPQSGLYDIWVGTYNGGYAPATLSISEIVSH
ncbi:MAG: peptidase S1 [Hyphomonadaceae bacterium]|nr:peptidase S1 [Hyphomonadaceae bacterium]